MNIKSLVSRFGGQKVLAEQLGIGQSAIAYWVKQQRIPAKWHEQLLALASSQGININASELLAVELPATQPVAAEKPPFLIEAPDVTDEEFALEGETYPFLFYTSENGDVRVRVFLAEESIWMTQNGMADIFDIEANTISYHLKNIFESNELNETSVARKIRATAADGKKYPTFFYNLDAIISVGYRVNSYNATQFRRWATQILHDYLIKGFVLDDERLKQGNQLFGKDYFEELLERIREIRASERRFYQKITDIYSQCSIDYDKHAPITKQFYAHIQDKLHFAIHGHTSAELIKSRADADKPHMGLTSWRNNKRGGKITKHDIKIGKNYLSQTELEDLNRLVSMYLDWAENFARRQIPMTMKDWVEKLDGFLNFNAYQVLDSFGRVKREAAEQRALAEFEKFRVKQDAEFQSDFDELIDDMKANRRLGKS